MPRPSLALLAALSMSGLLVAPASLSQGIPGLPEVIDDGRPQRRAMPAAEPAKGQLLDRVVAIVNEGIVTLSELEEALASFIQDETRAGRRPPPPERIRGPMLDRLIARELQLQRAERGKITVSDEELSQALLEVARRRGVRLEQLPETMKAEGYDYAAVRNEIRKEILIGRLEQRDVLQHINVTPRELDQFIERLKKMPNENDVYDVSDILISVPSEPTRAQLEEQQKKAQEVYERTANEDFASLAITYSDARTALNGGALGGIKGSELPTVLVEAVAKLKPGEVSRPFLTPSGYHIVKLNAVRRAEGDPVQDQVRVRHILLRINELQDAATVKLKLANVRQKILDGEDFAVWATTMSQDPGSAVDGGQLEWLSPDAFDPAFAEVVKKLKEGEISEPFESSFGWHIVQVTGRRKFDTTEDALRQRAFIQLRNSKAEEEIELWRRQMRDEAFVEIVEPKT